MTWMSTFEKLHRDVYSVLQKRAARTKCDLWVWDVFPTSLVQKLAKVRIGTLLAK